MPSENKAITKSQAAKRINELSKELERHNYLYYIKNSPEISDSEFDALCKDTNNTKGNSLCL